MRLGTVLCLFSHSLSLFFPSLEGWYWTFAFFKFFFFILGRKELLSLPFSGDDFLLLALKLPCFIIPTANTADPFSSTNQVLNRPTFPPSRTHPSAAPGDFKKKY